MRIFSRSIIIAFSAFALIIFPLSSGAGELRHVSHTTTYSSSVLAPYDSSQLETTILSEAAINEASRAVVLITAYEETPIYVYAVNYEDANGVVETRREQVGAVQHLTSSGSAFFVSEDGYLITNKHVVANEDAVYYVSTGEGEYVVRVVYRDPEHDIAVLKVHGNDFPALSINNKEASSELVVGEQVIAIGNALGEYIDSLSFGNVLSLKEDIITSDRSGWQIDELTDVIETSAKLYPGDSGGPFLNSRGEVVGVGVATTVDERIGYAVPAAVAKAALETARSLENI